MEKGRVLHGDPHTHTNPEGAALNADMVVVGLKSLKDSPFVAMLVVPPTVAKP